jgi:hypothetical protein
VGPIWALTPFVVQSKHLLSIFLYVKSVLKLDMQTLWNCGRERCSTRMPPVMNDGVQSMLERLYGKDQLFGFQSRI